MPRTRVHQPGSPIAGRRKNLNIPISLPFIFLAGPIRNAPDWHNAAIRAAVAQDWEGFIVSPSRSIALGLIGLIEPDDPRYGTFSRQRAWEQYYMYSAANAGCVMFWLCGEHLPKKSLEKVYAHITMMELGKWIERKKLIPETRLVIGTDGNFPEWSTIEFELDMELPGFHVCRSLEETVRAATIAAEG